MGILSNFLGLGDAHADETPAIIRPVTEAELLPAIRLLLGSQGTAIHEQYVQDFLGFARERNMDLGQLRVAEKEGRMALAALPVPSPGKTMLVFASPLSHKSDQSLLSRLIDSACDEGARRGVHLAEALIDPADDSLRRSYEAAGFGVMAELIYLVAEPRGVVQPPPLGGGFRWETYAPANHRQFAEAILASYRDSLDCPALNGQRAVDDVIEGHKASGIFDPARWFLLWENGHALGLLLLADAGRGAETMELVYVGLTPAARGRKLGEILMKQALATCTAAGFRKLTLAVDARNIPALKLYFRHGMTRLTSKLAMMRDLRPA